MPSIQVLTPVPNGAIEAFKVFGLGEEDERVGCGSALQRCVSKEEEDEKVKVKEKIATSTICRGKLTAVMMSW